MIIQNPKQVDTNLVDCVPQRGPCPIGCVDCYYNLCFYAGHEPVIPEPRDVYDKIVRMNSGHDSNLEKDLVLEVASRYKHVFFNTHLPNMDFPGPVVWTYDDRATQKETEAVLCAPNLMFVRYKLSQLTAYDYDVISLLSRIAPVVITFMRYRDTNNIQKIDDYEEDISVTNKWWQLKPQIKIDIMKAFKDNWNVTMCGSLTSNLCKDCKNCETYYWQTLNRINRCSVIEKDIKG